MKKIITDCDGVLLDWCFAFDIWMKEQGYVRFPETDQYFAQSKRYGIDEDEALEQVHKFNETGVLGFVPAYKDSVEFVTKFAREGWRFEVITMIGKDKYAHQLRKANLKHLFGDVFDYIYCAGDFRKPKKDILEESLEHELHALSLYKKLLTMVEGASIYLEEYTRDLIGQEEQHQLELRKMLKDFS